MSFGLQISKQDMGTTLKTFLLSAKMKSSSGSHLSDSKTTFYFFFDRRDQYTSLFSTQPCPNRLHGDSRVQWASSQIGSQNSNPGTFISLS